MERIKQKQRQWVLERKNVEVTLAWWWPPDPLMRLTCFIWGHEDIWDLRHMPTLGRCRYCGKDLSYWR